MKFTFSILSAVILSVAASPATPASRSEELNEVSGRGSATTSATAAKCGTAFQYTGVNESGAEFGNNVVPGTLGKDYIWPEPSSIDYFMGKGMNTFRIPFLLERLAPPSSGITGSFDATYLSGLKTIAQYITNKGGYAVIEPHNFMIYNGGQITDSAKFATFWSNLAKQFSGNSRIIFDLMNEPHDIAASTVFTAMQAAVNAIRSAGATQLILVEGTSWTGAWTWVSSGNGAAFAALKDPGNNIAIEMHQYLDSDGSGTNEACVSTSIGVERLTAATAWLKQTGFKGFLGEIGVGNNAQCITALSNALCSLQQSGVWIGWLDWAAGPWWGTYFLSIEPPSGVGISQVLPTLQQYIG